MTSQWCEQSRRCESLVWRQYLLLRLPFTKTSYSQRLKRGHAVLPVILPTITPILSIRMRILVKDGRNHIFFKRGDYTINDYSLNQKCFHICLWISLTGSYPEFETLSNSRLEINLSWSPFEKENKVCVSLRPTHLLPNVSHWYKRSPTQVTISKHIMAAPFLPLQL